MLKWTSMPYDSGRAAYTTRFCGLLIMVVQFLPNDTTEWFIDISMINDGDTARLYHGLLRSKISQPPTDEQLDRALTEGLVIAGRKLLEKQNLILRALGEPRS